MEYLITGKHSWTEAAAWSLNANALAAVAEFQSVWGGCSAQNLQSPPSPLHPQALQTPGAHPALPEQQLQTGQHTKALWVLTEVLLARGQSTQRSYLQFLKVLFFVL